MKVRHLFLFVLFFSFTLASAQEVPFNDEHFPDQKRELKAAKKQMKKGMKKASKGIRHREEALTLLKSAHDFNPNHAKLNLTIGNLLYAGLDQHKALLWFEKAYSLNNSVSIDIQYLLGRVYHVNHNFDLAQQFYKAYFNTLKPKESRRLSEQISVLIRQAEAGDSLVRNPASCFVDNLGDRVNSAWPEYSPVLSDDGKRLWFTSRRPGSTGGKTDKDLLPFEDIYYLEKTGSIWSDPVNAGLTINSEKHESVVALAPDNTVLYFRRGDPTGNLYSVNLDGKKRSKPQKLDKAINSKFNETTLTFSPDSTRVWFVSDRRGGYGGKDIWMSEAKKRGSWKKPVNAGPVINTPFDEESPFICSDGQTFWFSSKGHEGMGGFDIFVTTFTPEGYSDPVNVGYPVNSSSDDIHFSMDRNHKIGWFASTRPGGQGSFDIYRVKNIDRSKPLLLITDEVNLDFDLPGLEILSVAEPLVNETEPALLLRGRVICQATGNPVKADIQIADPEATTALVSAFHTTDNGTFLSGLTTNKRYSIGAVAKGFMPHSADIDLAGQNPFSEIAFEIRMVPLAVNQTFDLDKLKYSLNSPDPDPSTLSEVDIIVGFLKNNPGVKIMIAGFSTIDENQEYLARARAISLMHYISAKGVSSDQIAVFESPENDETTANAGKAEISSGNVVRIVIISLE